MTIRLRPQIKWAANSMHQNQRDEKGPYHKKTMAKEPFSLLSFFRSSWWMLVFCLGCITIYYSGYQKKSIACLDLRNKIQRLEQERNLAALSREDLQLQLDSQTDPAWIELTLMKQLGVVPEGHKKVCFQNEE